MTDRPSGARRAGAGGVGAESARGQGRAAAGAAPGRGEGGSAAPFTGRAPRRREDPDLLRGVGRYVGDVEPAATLHVAILRSPHAHAHIRGVDATAARALPGVAAVVTAADLGTFNRPIPNRFPHPALRYYAQYPLARDKVHYLGEPVAAVVADDRYLAEDALEQIAVD